MLQLHSGFHLLFFFFFFFFFVFYFSISCSQLLKVLVYALKCVQNDYKGLC